MMKKVYICSPLGGNVKSNGEAEWYTPLSNAQKKEIASVVMDYAEMYQDTQYALNMQFH